MLDRVRDKVINFERATGNQAKYVVLSVPPALELFLELKDRIVPPNPTHPLLLMQLDGTSIYGVKIVLLRSNKEIFEVG